MASKFKQRQRVEAHPERYLNKIDGLIKLGFIDYERLINKAPSINWSFLTHHREEVTGFKATRL